jgi:hypothetical protein
LLIFRKLVGIVQIVQCAQCALIILRIDLFLSLLDLVIDLFADSLRLLGLLRVALCAFVFLGERTAGKALLW